jgi:hypothetical protein
MWASPALECSIVDRESKGLYDLYSAGGSGCHPAREVALLRPDRGGPEQDILHFGLA